MAADLDNLEFRSPLVDFPKRDGSSLGLLVNAIWQRRLKSLWDYVQSPALILEVTAARLVTAADLRTILLCTGTFTVTLPLQSRRGDSYTVFNYGVGAITVAGTINGAVGYLLAAQYQYAVFTSVDGSDWIITSAN